MMASSDETLLRALYRLFRAADHFQAADGDDDAYERFERALGEARAADENHTVSMLAAIRGGAERDGAPRTKNERSE